MHPLPVASRDLVLVHDGNIKALLCWKSTKRETVNITCFKIYDSEHKCGPVFKELVTRIPQTSTLLVCLVDEYAVAEQVCLRDAGFELDEVKGNRYKFTREP